MVQLSTDDVFDGRSTEPYTEFDLVNPGTVYGKSKLAGENYVKEFTTKHFIVRSTWVYGKGQNFINDFLKKVDAGEQLSIASDQFGSPTSANELARFFITSGAYERVRNLSCDKQGRVQPLCVCTGDFENDRKDGFHAAGSNCHVGFFQGETGVCGAR